MAGNGSFSKRFGTVLEEQAYGVCDITEGCDKELVGSPTLYQCCKLHDKNTPKPKISIKVIKNHSHDGLTWTIVAHERL